LGRKWGRSPDGTADNSPAVHCREHVGTKRVPKGRLNSIPQIPPVEHERPQSLTQSWRDEFAPFFCAENQMNRIAHVRHADLQPSLRDSINSNSSPAVNCGANFISPSGRSTGIGTPECPNSSAGFIPQECGSHTVGKIRRPPRRPTPLRTEVRPPSALMRSGVWDLFGVWCLGFGVSTNSE
jgi:hypothetical protein